jgi:hypothetical protein
MKKTMLLPIIASSLLVCATAQADSSTRDPVLGQVYISDFKIPKDWKLVSVAYNGSSNTQAVLWFQSAAGEVFIVNGDYSNTSFIKKGVSIGKISTY